MPVLQLLRSFLPTTVVLIMSVIDRERDDLFAVPCPWLDRSLVLLMWASHYGSQHVLSPCYIISPCYYKDEQGHISAMAQNTYKTSRNLQHV